MRSAFPSARVFVLALAAAAVLQAGYAAWRQDWTLDERVHLEWSRRLLDERVVERDSVGRFNTKTPICLPHVLAHRAAGGAYDSRGARTAARLPTVFCLIALLAGTFALAREVTGESAAWVALALVSLDPNLVAHGSLATVDMPHAVATVMALWAALRFGRLPSFARGAVLGLALGVALLAKFTAVLLVFGLLGLVFVVEKGTLRRAPALGGFALAALVATLVVAAGYLFVDMGRPLGEIELRSAILSRLGAAWPELRLPLPAPFVTGIDRSLAYERGTWSIVLLGRLHPHGVWYYFGVTALLKTPLPLLLAFVTGAVAAARHRLWTTAAARFLLLNVALLIGYFSFVFQAQLGYRFVLMVLPLACVLVAPGLVALAASRPRWPRVALPAVSIALVEGLAYAGNPLSFTNAAVWPKRNVFRLLADSNVDWGQNRDKVAAWMAARGIPADRLDPLHPLPGSNVLTLNALAGTTVPFERYRWLRDNADPVAHLGHTYLVFDIDEGLYERLLGESRTLAPAPTADADCGADETPRLPPGSKIPFVAEGAADPQRWWLVCVSTPRGADLGLHAHRGAIRIGTGAAAVESELATLHQDQELWYRLEPGRHVLVMRQIVNRRAWLPSPFEGEWHVRRRGAALSVREIRPSPLPLAATTRTDPR